MGFLTGDTTGAEESLKRIFLKRVQKESLKVTFKSLGKG